MRVRETRAGLCYGNCCFLTCQHKLIQRTLRSRKFAVGRKSARYVACVTVQLAAGVYQYKLSVAHWCGISTVMQYTGVGTGSHDGAIGRILRALSSKFVQQFGVQVVLAHILLFAQHAGRQLHCANMRPGANLRCTAHRVLLASVLHQSHLVQQAAQVALLLGTQGAVTHP